jgi:hypothetical protein
MAGEVATSGDRPLEGKVYSPSRRTGTPNPPRTEYVLVTPKDNSGGDRARRWSASFSGRAGSGGRPLQTGSGFFSNRGLVTYAWLAAMAIIAYDEWHNNHILPRPARLWGTSVVYMLLGAGSMIDAAVPLVNALAIGYVFTLLWQLYNQEGQFTKTAAIYDDPGGSGTGVDIT